MLLKCSRYSKWSTDLIQSPSKFQCYSSLQKKKALKVIWTMWLEKPEQNTLKSQSNLEKKRIGLSHYMISNILQSYGHQNCIVLA